jgi:hypothetical protein
MKPIPLYDGDTFVISNSSLSVFTECPRQAEYVISRDLRPTGERVAQKFGSIIHRVLETRYRTEIPMYEQNANVALAMIATAEKEHTGWHAGEDDHRTYDYTCALIEAYGKEFPYESFTILKLDGRPAIEVPFIFRIGTLKIDQTLLVRDRANPSHPPVERYVHNLQVLWSGVIDMIYEATGGVYVLDHKTSSIATNMVEFMLAHQFRGYERAAEHLLGVQVAGTCINRIVCRRPSRTGVPFSFDRRLFPTNRALLAEWDRDILHIVADFIEMCRRDYLPKHTAWCVGKFGTCPFFHVCSLGDDAQREVILGSGEFTTNNESPFRPPKTKQ